MRYKHRHPIDWDEEIRKTERIRRKGLFVSALGFGIAALCIFGINRGNADTAELSRKIIFTACFVLSVLVFRTTLRRRERLKQERQEKQQEQMLERMRIESKKTEE